MKKNFLYLFITILVVAGFLATATQVSANPGGVKPTPKPSQSEKHTNNSQSNIHGNQNNNQNGNKNGATNGNKQNNSQSDKHGKNGKVANFIGTVSAVPTMPAASDGTAAPTLSVILRGGGTVDFLVNDSTIVKIPGMKNATIADIHVGDSVVVHALVDSEGVMTAKMINLVPGKPMHFHYVGEVTAYTPATAAAPGSITIKGKDGVVRTFVVTMSTMFVPPELATSLGVGVWVTVISGPAKGGGVQTAEGIVIFQTGNEGEVTAYTPAAAGAPGSITIKDKNGVETTFVVTTSTAITPAALAANLGVGVWVKIVSSPSPMGGTQTALTIMISTVEFTGEVTAYTAATATTPGSLTIKDTGGVSTTFVMTMTTAILPPADADKLVVGDLVNVVSSLSQLSGKQTALTVTITKVQYKGVVTAYTAATTSTPGSITIKDTGNVSTTFTVTMTTVILPAADADKLAVGAMVTVVPDLVVVTTPLTALSITIDQLPPSP